MVDNPKTKLRTGRAQVIWMGGAVRRPRPVDNPWKGFWKNDKILSLLNVFELF
jgi:hypothetical protein